MSTLADDLLKDFEDSGSEEGDEDNAAVENGSPPPATNGVEQDGMILDGDEEYLDDDDSDGGVPIADAEDQEEAKAKVEKMQLGGVGDVRNVAGLMKTLEPVLEVSSQPQICP